MEKKRNYARFYCLLKEVMPHLDQEEAKRMIADQMSGGRTSSLRELTDREFLGGVMILEEQLKGSSAELRKARSSALHQLQKYGVDTANWDAVNAFVMQPRIAGKPFYHLTTKELHALTRKMRAIISGSGVKSQRSRVSCQCSDHSQTSEKTDYQIYYIKTTRKVYGN